MSWANSLAKVGLSLAGHLGIPVGMIPGVASAYASEAKGNQNRPLDPNNSQLDKAIHDEFLKHFMRTGPNTPPPSWRPFNPDDPDSFGYDKKWLDAHYPEDWNYIPPGYTGPLNPGMDPKKVITYGTDYNMKTYPRLQQALAQEAVVQAGKQRVAAEAAQDLQNSRNTTLSNANYIADSIANRNEQNALLQSQQQG